MISNASGIYTISNIVNRKVYVGYALHFSQRKHKHFSELSRNLHKNSYLQASYNKYGKDNFVFEILEECDIEYLKSQEHYWCI